MHVHILLGHAGYLWRIKRLVDNAKKMGVELTDNDLKTVVAALLRPFSMERLEEIKNVYDRIAYYNRDRKVETIVGPIDINRAGYLLVRERFLRGSSSRTWGTE